METNMIVSFQEIPGFLAPSAKGVSSHHRWSTHLPFLFCGFMNFMQGSKKNCHHFFSPLKSLPTVTLIIIYKFLKREFFRFFSVLQYCFFCRRLVSTVSEDAGNGIEPRTVGIEPAGQLNRTSLQNCTLHSTHSFWWKGCLLVSK